MSDGLILFAHGARDPRWAAPFEAVARRIRERRPQLQLQLAYLELMAPSLAEAWTFMFRGSAPSCLVSFAL